MEKLEEISSRKDLLPKSTLAQAVGYALNEYNAICDIFKVVQDQHVFAIPDNGWNVVDIELDYYESYYSSTNTQNAFPFRQKFYMIKRSGAGANNISVDVSNALHTDGTNKVITVDNAISKLIILFFILLHLPFYK